MAGSSGAFAHQAQACTTGRCERRIALTRFRRLSNGREDHTDNRPAFAPETPEQNQQKRGEGDKFALNLLVFSTERSLHTGEVVGSIPTAPTILRPVEAGCSPSAPRERRQLTETCPLWLCAFNRSVQHRLQSIGRRLEAQGLSRTLIEPQSNCVQITLRDAREIGSSREVLPQQTVGVLV